MGVVFSARHGYPTVRCGSGNLSGSNPWSYPAGLAVPWEDSATRSKLYIDFSNPVSFVGAYFIDNFYVIWVGIYDIDNNLIGAFDVSEGSESGDSGEWWGVVTDERVIARITFEAQWGTDFFAIDNFVFSASTLVLIDIKPGSDPNCFNNDGHGVIPVAILTTDSFDAATVDPFSVSLDGASVRVKGKSGNAGSMEDVDNDGDLDLVVQIEDVDGIYQAGDTLARVTGVTFDGYNIIGQDTICIVP